MFKFIIIVALIACIVYWLRGVIGKGMQGVKGTHLIESDEMFECELCGTYVSEREALKSRGKYFCSNECLRQKV